MLYTHNEKSKARKNFIRVKTKVWLEKEGELIFGTGRMRILKAIEETGSMNKAAGKLGMSFRHVWSCINTAEKRLGRALLNKNKGGWKGGGATITEYAKNIMVKYEKLEKKVNDFTDQQYQKIFK